MKSFRLKALSIALLLPLSFACDDDDDGDNETTLPTRPGLPIPLEPPASGTPNGSVDSPSLTDLACETAWVKYVATHPIGLVLRFEHKTDIHHTGELLQDSSTTLTNEQIVIDSNIAHVVVKNSLNPTVDSEVTKNTFTKACLAGDPIQALGLNGRFQIQNQTSESVTVKAGTFDANYVKGILTTEAFGRSIASNTETWVSTDDRRALLKMISGSETVLGANTVTTSLTVELLSIQEP